MLHVNIKYLNGVLPVGEKYIKVNFRGTVKKTVKKKGDTTIFFGEQFTWPLARKIENRDFLLIQVYISNIFGLDRSLGVLNIGLGSLAAEPILSIHENLVDNRRKITENLLYFDLEYVSPSTGVGNFESTRFNYPVFDITQLPNYGTPRVKLPSEKSSDDDDDFNMDLDQDDIFDVRDDISDLSLLPAKNSNLPNYIYSKHTKIEIFEVSVTIIKARELSGLGVNPIFTVTCGGQKKSTDMILQTNTPYYNQYMPFKLEMSRSQLMEEIIKIECFTRNIYLNYNYVRNIWPRKLIGQFTIDVRTVYSNEFHSFFGKWAILLDPKAPNTGSKGLVQVNISVLCPGDKPKRATPQDEENNNIEGNILIPTLLSHIRSEICSLTIMIYQAQDLPSMNTQAMTSFKHALMGEHTPLTNPYVEISFAGYTGKTKVIDNSYKPEWNQKVTFTERYPFLVTRIRIAVKNSNTIKDDTIATIFIELNKIMYAGNEDESFLPTYGPAWINLYGSPRSMSYSEMVEGDRGRNENLAEGVAYRGRLLIAIKTSLKSEDAKLGVDTTPCNPVSNTVAGKSEMYFLFGTIFECNLIPSYIGIEGKPVVFEMSIGKYGNVLDDKSKPSKSDVAKPVQSTSYINSVTKDRFCYSSDKEYFYIPYANKKPCLHMICSFEDHRPRLFIPNIIERLKDELVEYIRQANYIMVRSRPAKVRRYLKDVLAQFIISIDKCLSSVKACRGTAKKTSLDQKYQRIIKYDLERLKLKIQNIIHDLSRKNLVDRIKYLNSVVKMLEDKIDYPQHGVPDVFISIIQDGLRLGYARIQSRKLIYSVVNSEMGSKCGELNDIYLKKIHLPLISDLENLKIQGHLQMYLWLGLLKDMRAYRSGLPEGYNRENFRDKLPPSFVEYLEETMFQLRIYLMLGRNLIGSDDSGLSDPFIRVIFNDSVRKSIVINETRSPEWDQTIILDKILLYFSPEAIKESPPNIVLEVFDSDEDDTSEFIGRCFCQPSVFLREDEYETPSLQWWSIFRGEMPAGEILASAEILEMGIQNRQILVGGALSLDELRQESLEINQKECKEDNIVEYRVPKQIRPPTKFYRLEVILWGMRQMRRRKLMNMNTPVLTIEFANSVILSDDIDNWEKMPNFQDNLVNIKFPLPEDKKYWPPISITVKNKGMFGKEIHIGNCSIDDVSLFLFDLKESDDNDCDKTTVKSYQSGGIVNDAYDDEGYLLDGENNMQVDSSGIPKKLDANGKPLPLDKQFNQDAPPGGKQMPNGAVPKLKYDTPGVVKKELNVPKDELESADWWTRYYTTNKDIGFLDKLKDEVELLEESQEEDELTEDILNDIKITVESDDDEDIASIPDEDKGKKRKKKKKKKKKKKFKSPFKKDPKELFLKEENDDLVMESGFINDNSWIERIVLYTCALENVKDFGGFKEPYLSFPLYYGKQLEEENEEMKFNRFGGVFKGNFCLYEISEEEMFEEEQIPLEEYKLAPMIKDNTPRDFTVRIYVVRGINLHPMDMNGKSDPYIIANLGTETIGTRNDYIAKSLNPMFGKCLEVSVRFPQNSFLLLQVYDYDIGGFDDLIGETCIDLESRWLSKHRASCGYMPTYQNHGFLKWKDAFLPTTILEQLCTDHNLEKPVYNKMDDSVVVNGNTYYGCSMIEDDDGSQVKSNEPIALEAMKKWHEIVPDCKLVPEHIETRPLYRRNHPGIEQGLLEMWVDMFPSNYSIPALIDITPRKAVEYELRITIITTEKVRLNDTNWLTNEKSVDIYLKGWMISTSVDLQKTDTHWRSLSGQGMFNYRFVFQFGYLKPEDATVYTSKEIFEMEGTEKKIPCFLNMQVMDNDLLGSDDVLGSLKFKLSKFPQPAKSYRSCCAYQHADSVAKFNLFRNKKARGWWPLCYNPKDEDPDEEDGMEIGGCVEMEMELLLKEEADSNPVGKGRDEPQPLPAPNRPDGSFLNMLNPLNTIKYFIKYRLKWILIKIFVIFLAILIIALFIYNFPGQFSRIIVDKMAGN